LHTYFDRLYAARYAELEIQVHLGSVVKPDTSETKQMFDYFLSTPNRRIFGVICCKASLEDQPLLVTDCAKQLAISRQAINQMISECEDAGWIIVDRNEQGHRYLSASEELVFWYIEFTIEIANISQVLEFGAINAARKMTSHLPDGATNHFAFAPLKK